MKIQLLYNICHCTHGDSVLELCHYSVFVKGAVFKAERMEKKPIIYEWCSGLKSHKEADEEVDTDAPGYGIELKIKDKTKTINYWIPLHLAEEIIEKTIINKEDLIKPIIERLSKQKFLKEIQKY